MDNFTNELRQAALHWLSESDAEVKSLGVRQLAESWCRGQLRLDSQLQLSAATSVPGRPLKPELVAPREVRRRSMATVEGRAVLIHALVHIEFNAINLALDAIWRFTGMPSAYYLDWLKVAEEEAMHFSLLETHLQSLGYAYGDFPGHGSLWEMADKTRGDVLARMALVPRTLEARGLDAVPSLREKLAQAGDRVVADILDIILRDEIGHVAIGNRWYGYLCAQRDLDPVATYTTLALQYAAPLLRGPFNFSARRAAGFSETELADLGKL
jgi:uncharacterized ferritin-like protein (DUF455 family)